MTFARPILLLPCLLGLFAAVAQAADPENQPSLPDTLISDNSIYKLWYDDNPASTHFVPAALIVGAADALDRNGVEQLGNPRGYHDGYLDLGFLPAWFEGNPVQNNVRFWDCEDPANPTAFDCNGGFARLEQIVMPAPRYRARSESCVRMVLGHELFHHVEFGYTAAGGGSGCGKVFGTAVCEGQARAMQDKVYFDLDLDPAANCVAPFDGEVDSYLQNPDVTIWKASYRAALFWTYLMEQYGSIHTEPGYGADFITAWWELATAEVAKPDTYDITQRAIREFNPADSALNAFHDFMVANVVKDLDLTALPAASRARYSYLDDAPVAGRVNLHHIGPVKISQTATVAANGDIAELNLIAQRFGGDYTRFDLSACPAGRELRVSVSPNFVLPLDSNAQTPAPDAIISLILTQGAQGQLPSKLYKWRAPAFKTSVIQPNTPYTRAYVLVAGWHGTYPGRVSVRCAPAPLAPTLNLTGNQAQPGLLGAGSIRVALPSGDPGNPPIGGLNAADFKVLVGGLNAPVRTAVREGDGFRVHFTHPTLSGPGPFPLSVQTGTQSTTVLNAIRYDQPDAEVIVVLDLSSSMNEPAATPLLLPAVQKVREAAARMRSSARFGLIGHFGNGSEPGRDSVVLLPLAPLGAAQRSSLESVLSTLSASTNAIGAPGDAILTAEDQFTANGGNGPRSVLLIGDGAQGEGETAALAIAALIRSRATLSAVALGGRSDQPFIQSLATGSGGSYHYVPTNATGVDQDAFNLAFDSVQPTQTREHILLARQIGVPAGATVNESLALDASLLESAGGASFSAEVKSPSAPFPSAIRLFRPNGSEVLAGAGVEIITTPRGRVFQLATAPTGNWQLQVVGSSAAPTGNMDLRVILPEGRGPGGRISFGRPGEDETPLNTFQLGEPVEVSYATYKLANVLISSVTADIERPDGTSVHKVYQTHLGRQAFDDSEVQTFQATLDLQTLGSATGIPDGAGAPNLRGSYRVVLTAHYGDAAGGLSQTSTASFAVLNTSSDGDGDGLPDRYESAHLCLNPATSTFGASNDTDGDGLSNADERLHGTDPCNVDSDEGGETDGSEVAFNADPLDPADDAIGPIHNAEILTQLSGHEEFQPLPALAHTIAFTAGPGTTSVLTKVGAGTLSLFTDAGSTSANGASGRMLRSGLTAGQNYCYQLVPKTAGGRTGVASDIFCDTARTDMTAPTGSIVIDDGAAQTRNASITAHIAFDNESAGGAQMNVQLPDGSESGWVAFQSSYPINVSTLPRPGSAAVGVLLRDAAGNTSEPYMDDIQLVATNAAGNISGSVRGAGVALSNALVQVQNNNVIAPGFSAANGDFILADLPPGIYDLVFSYPGYQDAVRSAVTVVGGNAINLGIVDLQPVNPVLFGNGFE